MNKKVSPPFFIVSGVIGRYAPSLRYSLVILLLFAASCASDDQVTDPTDPEEPDDPPPSACYEALEDNWPDRLIGRLEFEHPAKDIWGYHDSETSRSYAIVGFKYTIEKHGFGNEEPPDDSTGVYIVDVTAPSRPELVSTVTRVGGWDMKIWGQYLYSVNGSDKNPGKIIDISDPENPFVAGEFPGAHNMFISDNGLLILSRPGLRIYDLNNNPLHPDFLWTDGSENGHDVTVINNTLYDFHGFDGTNIYDLTDPSNPELLGTIAPSESGSMFHQSGWPTADENFLILNQHERTGEFDDLDLDITIWDISDKTNPEIGTAIAGFLDGNATVHNVHIEDELAHFSYYTAGYTRIGVSNLSEPRNYSYWNFDTAPTLEGEETFHGAFGVYALNPDGHAYISDTECGLFIFK